MFMEQTRLLLISAREDYSLALNTVFWVQMREIPTTISDTMYAYMVAKDWCKWMQEPETERSAENPLEGDTDDYHLLLNMFERNAEGLENQIVAYQDAIEAYLSALNPNLVNCWSGASNMPTLKEDTRLFFRSLRYTAQVFEKRFHATFLTKILDEKQVPPMSELDRCE